MRRRLKGPDVDIQGRLVEQILNDCTVSSLRCLP